MDPWFEYVILPSAVNSILMALTMKGALEKGEKWAFKIFSTLGNAFISRSPKFQNYVVQMAATVAVEAAPKGLASVENPPQQ